MAQSPPELPPGLAVAEHAAAEVLLSPHGTTLVAVEGAAVAAAVVAAMRERLGGNPTTPDLVAAWHAGVAAAGGARLSAMIASLRDGRATIVHAGDLALHAISAPDPRATVGTDGAIADAHAAADAWLRVRLLAAPHTNLSAEAPLRIRTRAINLPGAAHEPAFVEADLADAARVAITSASIWAPLGDDFPAAIARDAPASVLAHEVIERARAIAQTRGTDIAEASAGTRSGDGPVDRTLVAAVASVPRLCAIVAVPPAAIVVAPAIVLTTAQRTVRRSVRAVLARAVGARAAAIVGGPGAGKTCILDHLTKTGALAATATVSITAAALRRAIKAGIPIAPTDAVVLVDRLADAVVHDPAIAHALADAIARGELALVTTATRDDLAAIARAHRALHDELAILELGPPTPGELAAIVAAWVPRFVARHRVAIDPAAVAAAIELSHRFAFGRAQPEAALFALEQACLRAGHAGIVTATLGGRGGGTADRAAVVAAIADQAGIPGELVEGDDDARAAALAPRLAARLHGQRDAAALAGAAIARGLERKRANPDDRRPLASLLLLGPTGTGKTETARLLAESWFLGRHALTAIDLSEYKDATAVTRLVGAAPGYVGHADRPPLATALAQRPHQVILFDEIEKAHPEVLTLLLQILDEGRLTTGQGEPIRFADAIVVLTSNLAAASPARVGFGGKSPAAVDEQADRAALARELRPELVARVDAVVRYAPLSRDAATAIALGYLARAADALVATERLAPARLPALRAQILGKLAAIDLAGGARALLRLVEETLIADRASTPSATPTAIAPLSVLYPYLETGRERVAAGLVFEPTADAAALAHAILIHPAGGGLLYVAYTTSRVLALTGDLAAAETLLHDLPHQHLSPPRVAQGRVRADLSGRPTGELVDRLLSGRS